MIDHVLSFIFLRDFYGYSLNLRLVIYSRYYIIEFYPKLKKKIPITHNSFFNTTNNNNNSILIK